MNNSDQNGAQFGTGSLAISQEKYEKTEQFDTTEQADSVAEVGSTPLIGTIILSSADEQTQKMINPKRIEKAVESLKKNRDIERRGF